MKLLKITYPLSTKTWIWTVYVLLNIKYFVAKIILKESKYLETISYLGIKFYLWCNGKVSISPFCYNPNYFQMVLYGKVKVLRLTSLLNLYILNKETRIYYNVN